MTTSLYVDFVKLANGILVSWGVRRVCRQPLDAKTKHGDN